MRASCSGARLFATRPPDRVGTSAWARAFYGPDKLGEAVRRFPVQPGRPWPYPAPPAVVPTQITRGALPAIAASLAGLVAVLDLAVVLLGPLLPFAALAGRGVRWARTTTVAMVAVMAVTGAALAVRMAPEPEPVHVIATGLQPLLAVGAWHQLYRGERRGTEFPRSRAERAGERAQRVQPSPRRSG